MGYTRKVKIGGIVKYEREFQWRKGRKNPLCYINIPCDIIEHLKLYGKKKAYVYVSGDRIIVEPLD